MRGTFGGNPRVTLSSRPVRPVGSVVKYTAMGERTVKVPKLVAFDLDGTLWYPEMYMLDGGAPFRRDAGGAVFDAAGERIKLLGDTLKVFAHITTHQDWSDTQIAYVSRTEYPEWAIPCLQQFPVPGHPRGLTLFDISAHNEIYPGSKLAHFKAIHKRSGIDYADMLFFDNERWNITEVSRLGVKSSGLSMFEQGAAAAGDGKKHKHRQKKANSIVFG
ncbi:acid phosphatase-domain-containing protein [Scenedesmus sp. NREL 46B-D3]|nr:acid phosphatase-domain-containing protein [Scenedesmus sp. NREL 46B-D3]